MRWTIASRSKIQKRSRQEGIHMAHTISGFAQKITEEIYFDDGSRCVRMHPAVKNGCVAQAGRYYSFELWRKPAEFGGVTVDQFWMKRDSVYGRQGKNARNYDVLVELFWAQCMQAMTVFDDDVVDSYILAKLLPHVRKYGSRRIFDDAILASPKLFGTTKKQLVADLERTLASSRGGMLDIAAFQRKTGDLLGRPELEPRVQTEYLALADELLGAGRRALGRWGADGLSVPVAKLQSWMKSFVRRRGNEEKKLALDMLSYECRAAMHRCYSAVWFKLLRHLEDKYELDEASIQYHRLMHFDVVLPSNLPVANFHLFHGHVFALHPGVDLFLQTPTGGELVGDYLRGDDGDRPFRRLLHGLYVGLCDYYVRSDRYSEDRKRSSLDRKVADPAAVDEAQTRGRGRRRLPGPGHASQMTERRGPRGRAL
jgi:hypothetical protein